MIVFYGHTTRWYLSLILFFCSIIEPVHARTYLAIEGNIAAGKTTLSCLIERELNACIIPEPVERWQHVGGTDNLLDLYYKDPKRWGYTLMNYAHLTFIQTCLNADPSQELHICDRSMYSGFYCFSRMLLEQGSMTPLEVCIYKEWFAYLEAQLPCKPDGFIYLRTTPYDCFLRAASRKRSEESTLSLGFFESLHRLHEEWLIETIALTPHLSSTPILVLDGNLDFKNDPAIQQLFLDKITAFVTDINTIKQTGC